MLTAKRTLVKSGPELWAEISDPDALGAHFAAFGEIRITRVADASLVEWEGERAAGRLELEPSGFGTRVAMTAEVMQRELPAPPAPAPAPAAEPPPEPKRGWFARFFRHPPEPAPAPEPPAPPAREPIRVAAIEDDEALAVLTSTLDALGSARHRPFSR